MTTTPDFRELCAELPRAALDLEAMKLYDKGYSPKPPPEPPTDEELKAWYRQWAKTTSRVCPNDRPVHFARAVLERWGK